MKIKLHELKINSKYFDAIACGSKNFEVCKNDRCYSVGDTLLLREHNGETYTSSKIKATVTYVLDDFEGLEEGYVILGIKVNKIKL